MYVEYKVREDAEKLVQAKNLQFKHDNILREWKWAWHVTWHYTRFIFYDMTLHTVCVYRKGYIMWKQKEKNSGKSAVAASK